MAAATTTSFFYGTGRRKTSIARVRLLAGEREVVVNGRSLEEHFGNAVDLADITMPFKVTNTEGRYNALVKVEGGGHHGQAGAIRHGIARALLQSDPEGARAALRPGHQLAAEGKFKDALGQYEEAARVAGERPLPLIGIGGMNMRLNRPKEALAAYERALAIEPDNLDALSGRAAALLASGKRN